MNTRTWPLKSASRVLLRGLTLLALLSVAWSAVAAQPASPVAGQRISAPNSTQAETAATTIESATPESGNNVSNAPASSESQFRIQKLSLSGGAELLTVFGRLDGLRENGQPSPEIPLVSVLRDTLGDDNPENDRLRYVWMLTYTQPSMAKRVAAAIPFLYRTVGNKKNVSGPPSPIMNLSHVQRATWNKFFWWGVQNAFLDTYGLPLKASTRTYRQNLLDYRKAHVAQALAILGTYHNIQQRLHDESEFLAIRTEPVTATTSVDDATTPLIDFTPAFTPGEMLELRARLLLSQKTFGGLYGSDKFDATVAKHTTNSLDFSGHNWELLRQQAEADGLYFEPLTMPDGTATHALLWIAKSDLDGQADRRFTGRFLNISNPWKDRRLKSWRGYSETRFFDGENRRTSAESAGARRVEMIPLALYGLNHPKIPALLIDFRDGLNAKKREMSRRLFNDLAKNMLSLSSFGNLPYFAGRKVYGFLTGRRGIDMNQPSRLRSYSELKLVLAFNSSIDPKLRDELERRLESVSINPMANDANSEIELARKQYDALVEFARRDNGLPAKIERDRREEMVPLVHGRATQFLFGLGNILTFGRYVHREDATPELTQRLELARRVQYHTHLLQQVAKSSPQTEVAWDMTNVRRSLRFLADNAAAANGSAAKVAAQMFQRTTDDESRMSCLDVLSRINDKTARKEMLRLFREQPPQSAWRAAVAERLRKAVTESDRIKPSDAKVVLAEIGGP
ncbi:MAG TPA: hypothetical protein VIF81_00345 [Pyrinomonadaceae bacterium]